MPRKTLKGAYCSPQNDKKRVDGGSCYTQSQLEKLVDAANAKYGASIAKGSVESMWSALDRVLKQQCDNERCWAQHTGVKAEGVFRPDRPGSKSSPYEWLSTNDIESVLQQYEDVYDDYLPLGPYPIDFCTIGSEICNMNFWTMHSKGKRRISVVFNTDPSHKSGQHWISMFIDMSSPRQADWEAAYFDSYGKANLPKEIHALVKNIKSQMPFIKLKLNCSDALCTVSKQHQQGGSECGVYCLYFITERLKGRKWEDLVVNNRATDKEMKAQREQFFYGWEN